MWRQSAGQPCAEDISGLLCLYCGAVWWLLQTPVQLFLVSCKPKLPQPPSVLRPLLHPSPLPLCLWISLSCLYRCHWVTTEHQFLLTLFSTDLHFECWRTVQLRHGWLVCHMTLQIPRSQQQTHIHFLHCPLAQAFFTKNLWPHIRCGHKLWAFFSHHIIERFEKVKIFTVYRSRSQKSQKYFLLN